MILKWLRKDKRVLTPGLLGNKKRNSDMSHHTNCRSKSENSGFKKRERTEKIADTSQLVQHTVKETKNGNNSFSQLSKTDTHDIFTDYDAVEIFNRVLLKKCNGRDP